MLGRRNRDARRTNWKARGKQHKHSASLNSYIEQALKAKEEEGKKKSKSPGKKVCRSSEPGAGHRNKSSGTVCRRPGALSAWSRYLCQVRTCAELGRGKRECEKEEAELRMRLLDVNGNVGIPRGVSRAMYIDVASEMDNVDEMEAKLVKLSERIERDDALLTELEAERDALFVVVGHTTMRSRLPEYPLVNLALFVLNLHPLHDTEEEITRNIFINKGKFTLFSCDWRRLKLTSKAFAEFVMRNCVLHSGYMVSRGCNGRCRVIPMRGSIQFAR